MKSGLLLSRQVSTERKISVRPNEHIFLRSTLESSCWKVENDEGGDREGGSRVYLRFASRLSIQAFENQTGGEIERTETYRSTLNVTPGPRSKKG